VADVRLAQPSDRTGVIAFYQAGGYRPPIGPADVLALAEAGGAVRGAARVCTEEGVLVLRGVRVAARWRRQGIGTRLVGALLGAIGDQPCYCIPLSHLEGWYARLGFVRSSGRSAPAFLQRRLASYRGEHGQDVLLMVRG
jgi:N-acetylglutamate synthase-like GNAT family acetyltransferase